MSSPLPGSVPDTASTNCIGSIVQGCSRSGKESCRAKLSIQQAGHDGRPKSGFHFAAACSSLRPMSAARPVLSSGRRHADSRGPAFSGRSCRPRRGAAPLRPRQGPADRLARTAIPIRAGTPRTSRSPIRRGCSWCRTITSSACSTARASRWRTSASRAGTAARSRRTRAPSGGFSPSTTTCSAARRRGCGSTTPSRRCSGSSAGSRRRPPTIYYDIIADALAQPEFRPRALFERFNIEVIATTESPLDELKWHAHDPAIGLAGPRHHRLPARSGRRSRFRRLSRQRRPPRRAHRRGHGHVGRLSRGAPQAARLLQVATARPRPTTAIRRRARPTCRRRPPRPCSGASRAAILRPRMPSCSAPRCSPRWRA